MNVMPLRVVKLGGSLLDCADLSRRVTRWLDRQRSAPVVMIVGGGPLVDTIRRADRRYNLGEAPAHWLSIDAMRVTARIAAAALPEFTLATDWHEATSGRAPRVVFDTSDFLHSVEPSADGRPTIPQNWSVTSDSIAARVAQLSAAAELVLLKSTLPGTTDVSVAASSGYVDDFFPTIARALGQLGTPIRCVNLRDARFAQRVFALG